MNPFDQALRHVQDQFGNVLLFIWHVYEVIDVFCHRMLNTAQIPAYQQVFVTAGIDFLLLIIIFQLFRGVVRIIFMLFLAGFATHILLPGYGI